MDWDNRKHFQVELYLLLNVYLKCCLQDRYTVAGYRLASIKIHDTSGNIKYLSSSGCSNTEPKLRLNWT